MEIAGDVTDINYKFATEKSALTMELEKVALANLKLLNGGRYAFSHVALADFERVGAKPSHAEDVKDLPRTVEGVVLSAFFKEAEPDTWRVSVRTNGKRLDASKVCLCFGGGGHFGAAGCTVHGTINEVQARFEEALKEIY